MVKLHCSCSNCGKREVLVARARIPYDMYSLGYRAVGSALYCPQCVETWKERNGEEFDEQIANPTTQFANWWNDTLASQIDHKDSVRTYMKNCCYFVEE